MIVDLKVSPFLKLLRKLGQNESRNFSGKPTSAPGNDSDVKRVAEYTVIFVVLVVLLALVLKHFILRPNLQRDVMVGDDDSVQLHVLYAYLRQIALGPGATTNIKDNTKQRFILQIPGKILNSNDYDATNYSLDTELQRFSISVPPNIEENLFRLSDIIPAIDPMRGVETGDSFAEAYEAALNIMDVRGFDKLKKQDQARYNESINFLAEVIPDPENVTQNISRLAVYKKYRKRYFDLQIDFENKINSMENVENPIEYHKWFQIHYPAMQADLEDLYTEFLVHGQKDKVEYHKARLDVGTHMVDLQKARISLRSSMKISLDRATTYYPVHYEPSNWYRYIQSRHKPRTRKAILMELAEIDAKLHSITHNENIPGASEYMVNLSEKYLIVNETISQLTKLVEQKKLACLIDNDNTTVCDEYRNAEHALNTAFTEYIIMKAQIDTAEYELLTHEDARKYRQSQIKQLEDRKTLLYDQLHKLPSNIETDQKIQEDFEAGWIDFEFDSTETQASIGTSAVQYATALISSKQYSTLWKFNDHSAHANRFQEQIRKSQIKIKGKLLKVTIKRPWFKSGLFKSERITTRSGAKISPGYMTEKDFIMKVLSDDDVYILPEYVTGFLIAKDIEMYFSGVDAETQRYAVKQSTSRKLSGSYGCFRTSTEDGGSNMEIYSESNINGLKMTIPGAQSIGYYTNILPCFPRNLCNSKQLEAPALNMI